MILFLRLLLREEKQYLLPAAEEPHAEEEDLLHSEHDYVLLLQEGDLLLPDNMIFIFWKRGVFYSHVEEEHILSINIMGTLVCSARRINTSFMIRRSWYSS